MTLWEMLGTLAVANVLSFGNGQVMAALLQHSFVQQAGALTNDQFLYAYTLARVTPGQANLYVASIGYLMFRLPGACLSMVVIAAPGYLMIPLMRGYEVYRRYAVIGRFTRGLAATAVGLLIATTWNLGKSSMTAPVSWVVLACALGLMVFTRLPTAVSLLLATALGMGIVLGVPGAA